jgi:hypothetical protein
MVKGRVRVHRADSPQRILLDRRADYLPAEPRLGRRISDMIDMVVDADVAPVRKRTKAGAAYLLSLAATPPRNASLQIHANTATGNS